MNEPQGREGMDRYSRGYLHDLPHINSLLIYSGIHYHVSYNFRNFRRTFRKQQRIKTILKTSI